MQVIATDRGFDGLKVRDIGDTFEMPEGSKAKWFEAVDKTTPEAKVEKPKSKAAKTHSEASKQFEGEIA